jgi:hypothetical protein
MLSALPRIVFRNKHVPREQVVPRELGDDADGKAVGGIGAAPRIQHVELLVLDVAHHVAMQRLEVGLLDGTIDRTPVDVLLGRRLADGELVLRRPPGVLTGPGIKRTFGGELPFIAAHSLFVEESGTQVPVDVSGPDNTKRFKAVRPLNLCAHLKAPHCNGVKAAPTTPPDGGRR